MFLPLFWSPEKISASLKKVKKFTFSDRLENYCVYSTRDGEQTLGIFNSQKCTVFEIQAFKVEILHKNDNLRDKLKHSDKTKIWRLTVFSITVTILRETANNLSVFSTLKSVPFWDTGLQSGKVRTTHENENLKNKLLKHSDKTKIRDITVLSITVTILRETANNLSVFSTL